MYRYFIQPIFNKYKGSLVGYEMLIREYVNGHWRLPQCFSAIPKQVQSELLVTVAQKLSRKIGFVYFNLTWEQFLDNEFAQILIKTQKEISPVTLVIEIIEEPVQSNYSFEQIIQQFNFYRQHGALITLDDVGTGINTLENIQGFLPYIFGLKFPLQNFRAEGRQEQIITELATWKKVADTNNISLVVEGVENEADDQFLDNLEISYRQGYHYGKPRLFE